MKVGILAIQGDFSLHKESLDKLDTESIYVRSSDDLKKCDSLILPGGESTTMSLLLSRYKLNTSIYDFSTDHTIFGVCAGSILMSKKSYDLRVENLNLIKMDSLRNAWGNQIDSFSDFIDLNKSLNIDRFNATFIRAPKFKNLDSSCEILATYKSEPVLIKNKMHFAASFHPEIGNDTRIFEYFLKFING